MIFADIVDHRPGRIGLGRVLQIMVEEGLEHIAAPLQRVSPSNFEIAQGGAVIIGAAVPPGADHQIIVVFVAGLFQRGPAMNRAPHVFLVEQALLPHGGHVRGCCTTSSSSAWPCQNSS